MPSDGRLLGHHRGKVLVQAMLMLAGGGESCADIEYLRPEESLFGEVCSDSTLYRTLRNEIDAATLAALKQGSAELRAKVWRRAKLTKGHEAVVLDIDASLIEVVSENKEDTAPNYKGGFGFHPMFCFADATGEALSSCLRPGNAAANDAADHLAVLDEGIAQLPEPVAVGHRPGDDHSLVRRKIVSGRRRRSGRTRKGSKWLSANLAEAAEAAGRSKATYLGAQFQRLRGRVDHPKARKAVEHSMLVAAFHVLNDRTPYQDLGADWFQKRRPDAHARRLARQIEALGFRVTIEPAEAA